MLDSRPPNLEGNYVECDRPGQHEPLKAFLSKIGYDARWHRPPLFTKDNWAGHPEDTTRGLVSANLLCYPVGTKLKLSHIDLFS